MHSGKSLISYELCSMCIGIRVVGRHKKVEESSPVKISNRYKGLSQERLLGCTPTLFNSVDAGRGPRIWIFNQFLDAASGDPGTILEIHLEHSFTDHQLSCLLLVLQGCVGK